MFNDTFFTTGAGKGYHLPSRWEWNSIFSYSGYIKYGNAIDYTNFNEAIEYGGTKNTHANDFYSTGNGICYALRYKRANANPIDGSSITDFPWASDDTDACAFRYEWEGTMNTVHLKVQCVYVGDQSPLPDLKNVIAQESWWSSQPTDKVITRIFPATGYILVGTPFSSSGLYHRNTNGWCWSSTDHSMYLTWYAGFNSSYVISINGSYSKNSGCSVRPFSNE